MASSCPHPFIDESRFPSTGAAVSSRWCELLQGVSCCLPCPVSYWRWKNVDWLVDDVRLALWPSIPVLIALVWLLVTYAIFPTNQTDRHYLNVAPVIGFTCLSISFIVPSRGHPRECYNDITPADMRNDGLSALMGLFLFFGAWVIIISASFRSVALHLIVCWEVKLGQTFKYLSLAAIFVGSAALVAILLSISGLQYTFGRISYIVPNHDRATFWGPLLAISAASLVLQLITIIYCVILVLRPWFGYQMLRWSGYTPSPDVEGAVGVQRTALRIRKIVRLQWRNILITVVILIYVCFLASVCMQLRQFHAYPVSDRRAWFNCLASSKGDKSLCLPLARPLGPSEPELIAVLFLLVMSGTLAVAVFYRVSMYHAWVGLLRGGVRSPTPVLRMSHRSSPEGGESDVEIATRVSSAGLSQVPPSDAGSLAKSQTVPSSMA